MNDPIETAVTNTTPIRRVSLAASVLAVVASMLVIVPRTQEAEALPNGLSCGTETAYDWGSNGDGSPVPSIFEMNGVQGSTNLSDPNSVVRDFETRTGNHGTDTGYIYFYEWGPNDNQFATFSTDFTDDLHDLRFELVDIDENSWTDIVRVRLYHDGVEVTAAMTATAGSLIGQTAANEWEGTTSTALTDARSRLTIEHEGPVDRIEIDYEDGPGSGGQLLGVSDFYFCAPQVGTAKSVTSGPTYVGDGAFDVAYQVVVENLGGTALHDIGLIDDLASEFGSHQASVAAVDQPGEYTVSSLDIVANSADPLAVNSSFTGSGAQTNILDGDTGSLALGEAATVEVTVTFFPDMTGGSISLGNQVTASGDTTFHNDGNSDADTTDTSDAGTNPDPDSDGQPDEAGENDPTSFTLTPVPSVQLTKTVQSNADEDGSGDVSAGDTLTYGFDVLNDGEVILTGISVTDPLTGTVSCPTTILLPDESATCTGTYSVSQVDVDAGRIDNTAQATGTAPDGAGVSDSDSHTQAVNQVLSIQLVKSLASNADQDGSGDVSAGDTLTYSFVTTNDGSVTLSGVAVSDPLAGLSGLVCSPAAGTSLAPGATQTCTATYTTAQTDIDSGSIDNTAQAAGTAPDGTGVVDSDTEQVLPAQNPSLTATKTLDSNADEDGSGGVTLGDTLTWDITVTNDGDVTLTGLTIDDPLTGGASCPATTLAPGASTSCSASHVVTQGDVDAGLITNTATATGAAPSGADVTDTDADLVVIDQNPSVTLDKTLFANADEDGSGDISLGDTLTYQFIATNTGNVTLTDVAITDPLPGLTGPSCAPATLAPGASTSCTATYAVTQADVDNATITNTATATAGTPAGSTITDDGSETVSPDQNPGVSLTKSVIGNDDADGSTDISLGDTLTYQFIATNTGDVTLTSVTITDPLPGLSALTCIPANGATLSPGQAQTCTATYTVTGADVDAGRIDNTATVSTTPPQGGNVMDTASDQVTASRHPSIDVVKNLTGNDDADGSGSISVGDTLTYTFGLTNDGDTTLSSVGVTDPLITNGSLTCAATELAPAGTTSCAATYQVSQADIDSGRIDNTATASGTDPGGTTVTASDQETVFPPQNPSIVLVKSLTGNADEDGSGDISVNDTLTYTFDVTNDGDVTLTDLVVNDPLTGGAVTCPAASLAPGDSTTCQDTHQVAQAEVDVGRVDNTATATTERPGGDPGDPGDDVVDSDSETVTIPRVPAISVVKSVGANNDADGSGTISVGDTITYEFEVTNDGNVTLSPVGVSDPLPGLSGVSCPGASLAPGAAMSCSATYTVTQTDVDNGAIDNTVSATGTAPDGGPVTGDDTISTVVPQIGNIELFKALTSNDDVDGSGTVTRGDTLTFGLTATNTGNVTLTNVRVTDPLSGLSVLTCTPAQGDDLAPGAAMVCSASYTVVQADVDAGTLLNNASAVGTDPGNIDVTSATSLEVTIEQAPSLSVVKTLAGNDDADGSGGVSGGDTLSWDFTVTNVGDVTLTGVTLSDPLIVNGSLSCVPGPGSPLAPGSSMACTATQLVTAAQADAGSFDNTATATAFDPGSNPVSTSDTVTTPVDQNPAVALDKMLTGNDDPDSSGDITVGDTLTWTITATNTGDVTLTDVTISDPFVGALACTPANGSDLAAGASLTCVGSHLVTQTDVDNGQIDNTAQVTGSAPNGAGVMATDSTANPTPQNPALDLTKAWTGNGDEDGSGDVSLGDTLSWNVVATNTGDVTLDTVTVSDSLATSLACTPSNGSDLAPGSTLDCTASLTVTQAMVDAGEVANTASARGDDPTGTPIPSPPATSTVPVTRTPDITITTTHGGFAPAGDADGSSDITLDDTIVINYDVTNT
ncbi:MAG: DUF11 domain-containing protein, partial [Actinomycetia bacterium]|nr:DUF11 domain-containing protein [Actinomycetes bacterium]